MHPLTRTARATGAFYLGLAITGMLGFLLIRPQVFVSGESDAVLDALAGNLPLARVGLLLELGIVVAQVLTALWFFKLFRTVNAFAAVSLATLGLMNATAILGSAASLGTAIQIADAGTADAAVQVGLLVLLSDGFWAAGVVFFGAWLIPMGLLVLQSGYAWRWIGWVLVVGGIGYMASIVLATLVPEAASAADLLVIPATIGEFSILLSLLIRGVPARAASAAVDAELVARS
jgi:hypothetical protein